MSYSEQVRLCHGTPIMVPRGRAAVELGLGHAPPRALVVCSPPNPTGKVYTRDESGNCTRSPTGARAVLHRRRGVQRLRGDEPFVSCGVDDPEKEHTIICNTMSKNYGMSGLPDRIRDLQRDVIKQLLKISQHLMTCPATMLEMYLERHFDEILQITKPQIRDLVERRAELGRYMEEIGLRRMPGTGAFYFFVSIEDSSLPSEEFCMRLLQDDKVVAVPGVGYGQSCDGFIRVGMGAESMDRAEGRAARGSALIPATPRPEAAAEPGSVHAGGRRRHSRGLTVAPKAAPGRATRPSDRTGPRARDQTARRAPRWGLRRRRLLAARDGSRSASCGNVYRSSGDDESLGTGSSREADAGKDITARRIEADEGPTRASLRRAGVRTSRGWSGPPTAPRRYSSATTDGHASPGADRYSPKREEACNHFVCSAPCQRQPVHGADPVRHTSPRRSPPSARKQRQKNVL